MSAKTQSAVLVSRARADTAGLLQRKCACGQHTVAGGQCEECRKREKAPAQSIGEVLAAPGAPLDEETREFLEPRLAQDFTQVPLRTAVPAAVSVGETADPAEAAADRSANRALGAREPSEAPPVDLGQVRVHTGSRAAKAASALNARAFTLGNHVVFGAGEYRPRSFEGQRLLAHELAHVLQPGAGDATIRRKEAPARLATDPEDDRKNPLPSNSPDQDKKISAADPADAVPKLPKTGPPPPPKPDDTGRAGDQAKSVAAAGVKADNVKEEKAEPKPIEEQSTGELAASVALIDFELAEHERWGAAAAIAGAAGSEQRASFITGKAGEGGTKGLDEGAKTGVVTGAAVKVVEKVAEKGLNVLVTKAAPKLVGQAAKFTPLPAVGAVIGGVMAAFELASRDWKATGETLGRIGTGGTDYEMLANTLEGLSTLLELYTQVLNVIAGVIGLISIIIWAVTVATLGAASPLAVTLSSIAVGIGIGTLILDSINSLVLKPMVTVFRALDLFTKDADPRDVVTQGDAIAAAAGATTGFVGGVGAGFAGGHLVEGGIHIAQTKPAKVVPPHSDPPPASGNGTTVSAKPPETTPAGTGATTGDTPKVTAPVADAPKVVAPDATAPAADAPKVVAPEVKATPPEGGNAGATDKPSKAAGDGGKGAGGGAGGEGGGGAGGGGKPGRRLTKKQLAELSQKAQESFLTEKEIESLAEHHGVPVNDIKAQLNELTRAKLGLSSTEAPPEVQPGAPRRRPVSRRERARVRQLTGEGTISNRVEKSLRAASRESTARKFQEASADIGEHTALTQESRANIEEHGVEHLDIAQGGEPTPFEATSGSDFVENAQKGRPPAGFEESHLVPVAQSPSTAHQGADISIYESKSQHRDVTHAGDTAAELETLTRRGEEATGFQDRFSKNSGVLLESRQRLAFLEQKAAAARANSQSALNRGQLLESVLANQEARNLDIQVRALREAIPGLERTLAEASPEARRDLGRAARATPAQGATATPSLRPAVVAPVTNATPAVTPELSTPPSTAQPAPKPQPGKARQPAPSPQPVPAPQPDDVPAVKVRVELPPEKKVPVEQKPPGPSPEEIEAQAEAEAEAEAAKPGAKQLALPPRPLGQPGGGPKSAGEPDGEKKEKEGFFSSGFFHNVLVTGTKLKEADAIDPKSLSATDYAISAAGGTLTGPLAVKAKHDLSEGFDQAQKKPRVAERVNPHYAPPPYKPQDIVDAENEVLRTLEAKAKAEAAGDALGKQEKHHKDNQQPLTNMQKGTADAINATAAHQEAVKRRDAANEKAQKKEKEVKGSVETYAEKKAGLVTLTGPMKAVKWMTGFVYGLGNDPEVLIGFKRHIIKLNKDCTEFLDGVDKMDKAMDEQKNGQAGRDKNIQKDAATIKDTGTKAAQSDGTLNDAKKTTEDFDKDNTSKVEDAGKLKGDSAQLASQCGKTAEQKRAQAQRMAADLQAWAQQHKQSREDATNQTKQKYEKQGYTDIQVEGA